MTSKVFLALRVPADPMRAFEVFTQQIALWWQPSGLFRVSDSGDGRLAFEPVGAETRISIEHRAWHTIPRKHAARHGFPEQVTLQRAADWWRNSLQTLKERLAGSSAAR